jgi:tetratricopeptide (TPR) repeat protein
MRQTRLLAQAMHTVLLLGALAAPADEHHAATGIPASLAEWAQGARLYEGLGGFHRPVTTSSPVAQQYFDQGMRFLWAFNHDESTRSFARAAVLDPACAACYWGVALTVGPNYNLPEMATPRAQVAWQALQSAREQAPHASVVERALIEALAVRYPTPAAPPADAQAGIATAYAAAMDRVAGQFPDDLDVQTLAAEAQMNVHAWKLWTADGQPVAGTPAIEARLEAVLGRDPRHPGANHYYIHVMEASPDPGKALAAAKRLRGLMPAAGHLEHMPAHILQRVGRYEEAAEANRRGAAADREYFGATRAPDYYPMYLGHNYAFLAYSAAMEGRKAETLDAVQRVAQIKAESGWALSVQYDALLRFGLWDEMIALLPPEGRGRGARAAHLYGRAVALAARGRLDEARKAQRELEELAASVPDSATAGTNSLRDVLAVAQPVVAARIAASENRGAEAVTLLTQAVAAEDHLAYDEPSEWFFPARHLLGAQLLLAGQASQAETVYREDLRRNPDNGWALKGLALALGAQRKQHAAAQARHELQVAWQHADIRLSGSAYWLAGADTASCECEHLAAGADGP